MMQTIHYSFYPLLGRLYTIGSIEGEIMYVNPDDGDLQRLKKDYSMYHLIEDASDHVILKQQLTEYSEGERRDFDVPIRFARGTAFQQAVWQALLAVAFGQSISYSELSLQIERPTAVRAVAGAVGQNPLSILVGCHRVLGKDGSLTGYNGGLDVKKQLLAIEGIAYKD